MDPKNRKLQKWKVFIGAPNYKQLCSTYLFWTVSKSLTFIYLIFHLKSIWIITEIHKNKNLARKAAAQCSFQWTQLFRAAWICWKSQTWRSVVRLMHENGSEASSRLCPPQWRVRANSQQPWKRKRERNFWYAVMVKRCVSFCVLRLRTPLHNLPADSCMMLRTQCVWVCIALIRKTRESSSRYVWRHKYALAHAVWTKGQTHVI